jgi:hypothetical protein
MRALGFSLLTSLAFVASSCVPSADPVDVQTLAVVAPPQKLPGSPISLGDEDVALQDTPSPGMLRIVLTGDTARWTTTVLLARVEVNFVPVGDRIMASYGDTIRCAIDPAPPSCELEVPRDSFRDGREAVGDGRIVTFGGGAAALFEQKAPTDLIEQHGRYRLACAKGICSVRRSVLGVRETSAESTRIIELLGRASRSELVAQGWARRSIDALVRRRARNKLRSVADIVTIPGVAAADVLRSVSSLRRDAFARANPHSARGTCREVKQRALQASDETRSVLDRVTRDHIVSAVEWETQLAPLVDEAPKYASDVSRALLRVYADPTIDVHAAEVEIRAALRSMGYPLHQGRPPPDALEDIQARNITEPELGFVCLRKGLGGVLVAVVDGDNEPAHPSLAPFVWLRRGEQPGRVDVDRNGLAGDISGYDFATEGTVFHFQPEAHGVSVSSIAAGGTDAIELLPIQFKDGGRFTDAAVEMPVLARALAYATQAHSRVINLSQLVEDSTAGPVIDVMRQNPDVLFFVAAGNTGTELALGRSTSYALASAGLSNVAFVAASDLDGEKADFSNYHPTLVHLATLGDTVSAQPDGYGGGSGTSTATPKLTNLAAKMLVLHERLRPDEVLRILTVTSDKNPSWTRYVAAGGTVNRGRALRLSALLAEIAHGHATATSAVEEIDASVSERLQALADLSAFESGIRPAPRRPED